VKSLIWSQLSRTNHTNTGTANDNNEGGKNCYKITTKILPENIKVTTQTNIQCQEEANNS